METPRMKFTKILFGTLLICCPLTLSWACKELTSVTLKNTTGIYNLSTSVDGQCSCGTETKFSTDRWENEIGGLIERKDVGEGCGVSNTWVKVDIIYNGKRIAEYKYRYRATNTKDAEDIFFATWIADDVRDKFEWRNASHRGELGKNRVGYIELNCKKPPKADGSSGCA
jgi:hypothetical protein